MCITYTKMKKNNFEKHVKHAITLYLTVKYSPLVLLYTEMN